MGTGIERNLFQDYIFGIASGGVVSSTLYEETFSGTVPVGYIENPRLCLVGLFTPAALTSTTFGIEVSENGTTWVPVHIADGTAYTVTVAPSRYTIIPPAVSFGWGYIRLTCSAEGAARSVKGRFQVV